MHHIHVVQHSKINLPRGVLKFISGGLTADMRGIRNAPFGADFVETGPFALVVKSILSTKYLPPHRWQKLLSHK